MHRRRAHTGKGLSLAESLLACVLLAACITGVTMPFVAGAQNDQAQQRMTLACSMATELMEEILSHPFDDPQGSGAAGPEPGETTRTLFDNIDDYDGYTEAAGEVTNLAGQADADAAAMGLTRHATVQEVYLPGQDTGVAPTFARVTVEVRHGGDSVVTLTRLVGRVEQ